LGATRIHPDLLPEDPASKAGPKWRKVLLLWMLRRFELTGSPDNLKKQGESA